MALYRSPLTVTLWASSFLKKYGPMNPPAHKAHQTSDRKLEEGRTVTSVAVSSNHFIISRAWKAFKPSQLSKVRTTTSEDDRSILAGEKRKRQSSSVIAEKLYSNGTTSVAVYLARRLHKGGPIRPSS
ncbi:hypothetical protein TNCV_3087071 [Trichonephila clavipes]|nr:hypothetical protein TNCV_3087071 [Trichonephila clavipes]